jgi:hypothetical protein
MFKNSEPNRCFGTAIGSGLVFALLIVVAVLVQASAGISSYL